MYRAIEDVGELSLYSYIGCDTRINYIYTHSGGIDLEIPASRHITCLCIRSCKSSSNFNLNTLAIISALCCGKRK
jgi:hypothetical protein